MRKVMQIELVGVGDIDVLPVKVESKEYEAVLKDGTRVEKKVKTKGTSSVYAWFDSNGTEHSETEVFRDINGTLAQKVERSKKIKNYKITDKAELFGNFLSDSYALLVMSETTENNLRNLIDDTKAIEITLKKSSVGFKFHKAFITFYANQAVMYSGENGFLINAIKEYNLMRQAVAKIKGKAKQEVEQIVVSADEITIEM